MFFFDPKIFKGKNATSLGLPCQNSKKLRFFELTKKERGREVFNPLMIKFLSNKSYFIEEYKYHYY